MAILIRKLALILALGVIVATAVAQTDELAPGSPRLINPVDLVKLLQAPDGPEAVDPERGSVSYLYAGAHSGFRVHRGGFG